MEWLINRRRMMFNKAVPPAYLTFEDRKLWEVASYYWGDTELVQGTIGSGTITCDGTSLVYSDYVFAHCTAISSHKLSNGKTFSASAATQNFTVTVGVNDSSAFSAFSDTDTVIEVKQYSTTETSLSSITKADWTSGAVNNQITINVTSTDVCAYLRIGVLGANSAAVSWNITAITGSRQPLGITTNQCASVSSFGSVFADNPVIHLYNEDFLYFSSVTGATNNRDFARICEYSYVWFPYLTTLGGAGDSFNYALFLDCKNLRIRVDSVTKVRALFNTRNTYGNYVVITTTSVPSCTSIAIYADFYVVDELVNDYKAATNWSDRSSNIHSLHDLPTDHPDCLWLDDLRAKGLIPSN